MTLRCGLILAVLLLSSSCAHRFAAGDYDVVLEGIPMAVKAIDEKTVVDAIEEINGEIPPLNAVVSFGVQRVLVGEFTRVEPEGPSKLEQMKDAVDDRNILKLLTLDFSSPGEAHEKKWLSIAVADPQASFGLTAENEAAPGRYKIYLKREPGNPKSYRMVYAKKA